MKSEPTVCDSVCSFGHGPARWAITALRLAVALVGSTAFNAGAHDPGLSTATLQIKRDKLEAVLVFSTIDAVQLLSSTQTWAGQLPREQFASAAADLQKKAFGALEIQMDGTAAKPREARCRFDESQNATIYLRYEVHPFSKLVVRSKWLALLPAGHRQFMSIERADGVVLAEELLSATADSLTIERNDNPASAGPTSHSAFADFLLMGVKHIWTGYDHLLFLFGLLIVTRGFGSSIKIITCFTVAHSITLAVATLSLVHISSRIVEPLIAASIVYVGIENLFRGDDPKGRWLLTFAFGLVHGFGFASVLRDLGVGSHGSGLIVPLVSFNLGVELGQIVVAGLLLPVIWRLRNYSMFVRKAVPVGSLMVALLGGYWFIQRVWF